MATGSRNLNSNLNLSKNEIHRIENALKDKEFVKLLGDYAEELKNPENRKRYEEEIAAMEEERGNNVIFINPKPGYVLKTRHQTDGNKIFINICSDDNIGAPSSRVETVSGSQGLQWSIPYSQSQPREDIDRGGDKCMVYDVIFHHDSLYLAGKDQRMREVVHNTAMDAVDSAFQVKCDRGFVKFPKMKFKGVFKPTVIRRPVTSTGADNDNAGTKVTPPTMEEILPEISALKITTPEYSIKYRHSTDLQDHVINPTNHVSSVRPKEMILDINLPLLDSAAGVDLDVQEKSLILLREEPPKYNLTIDLPYPVNEEKGSAKFDKSKKTLIVSLPVKPAPQLKAERLGSNDSGIEMDTGYRTNNSEPLIMEVNAVADDAGNVMGEKSEIDAIRTKIYKSDEFLDENISYTLPNYALMAQNNVIILTLEVKNVSTESFQQKIAADGKGLTVKFCSIGSGFVPIHYAFAMEFLSSAVNIDGDKMEVEFWDNNVVIQLPVPQGMEHGYKVGVTLANLNETIFKLETPSTTDTNNTTTKSKKKKSKYQTEKHPKAMKPEEEKKVEEANSAAKDKIRYCSGDSVDSSMSESPMETIQLEYHEDGYDDDEDMKTEDSCDEDLQLVKTPRYKRAISEESQVEKMPKRGILKKRMSVHGTGGRFRCYSESNMHDLGSSDKLSFALSEATIAENETDNFSGSNKKSVSFSEKVQQQYYRINSAIIANTAKNKKKAEKKKRALERRMSEGDAGSLEALNKMPTSSSLDLTQLQEGWEEESHEDSGMSSSFEETLIVTGDKSNQVNNNPTTNFKPKSKRMTKRRSKQIQMANELIFDLDI